MIFCGNVAGVDGRDRSSFSDLAKQFVAVHYPELCGRGTHKHTSLSPFASLPSSLPLSLPQDSRVATGTYKALCGIVHEAQLEALLVLKGLCQGVTQVVRGQGALPTVLELGENTLKRRTRTWLHTDNGRICLIRSMCITLTAQKKSLDMWPKQLLYSTFNAQKMHDSPRQKCPGSCLKLRLKMSSCHSTYTKERGGRYLVSLHYYI